MISRRPALILLIALLATAPSAEASLFQGEALDKAANFLAIFILLVLPIGLVALFWMVHVIPEKIAEKNHHPQQAAIKTLCLLSLVFGGLLWPIAWLLAYTKPVGYKLAYGTDKHPNYFKEAGERAESGQISREELADVRTELDDLAKRGFLTPELRTVRDRVLARLQAAGTVEQP
jgi:CBS domain containing-hemolysin-like protein